MVIVEVGGTVGDIEIVPFLEAIRQFRRDVGRDNVCYVHLTLVPTSAPTGEQKTKPTQHSVTELRSRGSNPMSSSAAAGSPPTDLKMKDLAACATCPSKRGFPAVDAAEHLRDPAGPPRAKGSTTTVLQACSSLNEDYLMPIDLGDWERLSRRIGRGRPVRIGIIGKYVDLPDCLPRRSSSRFAMRFPSRRRPSKSSGIHPDLGERRPSSPSDSRRPRWRRLPGGFGERGMKGKIAAAQYAREHDLPLSAFAWGCK